jgi:hypothetical protein
VIESGAAAGLYAIQLSRWSEDVVLCTNVPAEFGEEDRARLSGREIPVRAEAIARLEADGDGVRIAFKDGPSLVRHAIFVRPPTRQRSDLAARLADGQPVSSSDVTRRSAAPSAGGLLEQVWPVAVDA